MIKRTLVSLSFTLAPLAIVSADTTKSLEDKVTLADLPLTQRCYAHVPPVKQGSTADPSSLPVIADADHVSGQNNTFVFTDNVNVKQDIKTLTADKITYNKDSQLAEAEGNVRFTDGQLTLSAQQVHANLQSSTAQAFDTDYQFHGKGGRGSSDELIVLDKQHYILNEASYTSCPPGDTTWKVSAKEFNIDNEDNIGTARHAKLYLKDIPIFYFPYFSYPLGNERKSGLLIPSVSSSSTDGFSYEQPIYWNIAPNYDATLNIKAMSDRGVLAKGEMRYLQPQFTGMLNAEYLPDDKIYGDDRYLLSWRHNSISTKNLRFNVDYAKVSDNYYLTDIDTPIGSQTDNQLLQTSKLSWVERYWNAEVEIRDFQVLSDSSQPHIVMPKIAFEGYYPTNWYNLEADIYAEATRFDHKEHDVYTGSRYHFEPKIVLPLYTQAAFINTELTYLLTKYDQDIPSPYKETWYADLDESVTRSLPMFSIHGGLNFERNANFFDNRLTQTLVPQVKYLYVPYENQDGIGLYDTAPLQTDYYALFRDRSYSGLDRVADANQLTVGVSSSFFNQNFEERFRAAIGQVFYFTPSRVTLPSYTNVTDVSKSALLAEIDVNYDKRWFYRGGVEFDTEKGDLKRGNSTIERRWAWNKLVQLNYRYIKSTEELEQQNIKGIVNQVGSKVAWPINEQWSAIGSYYYDIDNSRKIEFLAGVKYEDCCWGVSLVYDQHMKTGYGSIGDIDNNYKIEDSIKLQIELKGLANFGSGAKTRLSQGLFDYGRPFANK
ncbi:LPS assembly protein LptD [Motilimonas pumila]|uniref:LPS-assembly protein LptD n=1 Tax=Motilimonas pumila TaxID=2303987 RepID=A0A418YAB0_9GAMM|nr:LPS assembly protein LptD [Motilimonas pumila]RJG39475.1 LPS assembly protein LptD [Motilimonas pumila]